MKTRCQPRHEASDRPTANHGHPVTQVRTRIPQAVQRGFEIGGQYGSPGRHVVWQYMHCRNGDDILRLMRMQHEHRLALQIAWSGLDATYARISVFDRRRELAFLKRSAHTRPLAPRHPAVEHERLRTATHPAEERADDDLLARRRTKRLMADLSTAWFDHPECPRLVDHAWTFLC